jgi:glycerophosphoryl diester phosphodiesterase
MTMAFRRRGLIACVAALAGSLVAVPGALAQIEVHAHRGGSYVDGVPRFPENTMPAFRHAADGGFVLEIDAKLTKDRVPLVIHDDSFDRTTTCTGPISAKTAAEVARDCRADVLGSPGNDAGLPMAPVPAADRVAPPPLAELLAFARDRGARINLEIKNLPTDNDFDPSPMPAYATTILDAVDASRIPRSKVLIQSFLPANLDVAEQRGFETSALTLAAANQAGPEGAKSRGYEFVSPAFPVDQAYVSRAHGLGLRVVPFTLDREAELRAAAAIGVDELITDDPTLAARTVAAAAPRQAAAPGTPSDATCRSARASRTLAPVTTFDPKPGAPRVFAMQFKQDARHVVTYAAFRAKIECTLREMVVPFLAKDRPNVVAFNEDIGLATIATGSRGRLARDIFTDPSLSPSCNGSAGAPCGAFGALTAVKAAYGKETAAYQARFPDLNPVSGIFVATTDTFARGWMQTFSDLSHKYGVYMLGSNDQPLFRESTDPAEIATFADPDLPERPSSVFVATSPAVYNEAFLWGPRDVRASGPAPLRNVVARNKKVPVTPIEELINLTPGPRTGPDAIENVAPYALPGTQARISFATSLPAFVYGALPPGTDPCSDVAKYYMRCIDKLGANLVMQDEANPGSWAAYTAKDSPDRGAWQTMSWMTSTWRASVEPSVGFAYNVTPHLVGNLADLPFDGQTAITQRGLSGGAGRASCNYVGSSRFIPGTDPESFLIGGEELPVRPFAGPKQEFLAMVPWVRADGPRPELESAAKALTPEGNGPGENDYLETAIVADLPFPPNPARGSCATAAASAAGTGTAGTSRRQMRLLVRPQRVRVGRLVRYRFRAVTGRGTQARPVSQARVTFAGRRATTDRRGYATMVKRLGRPGRFTARATRTGLRSARVTVRAVAAARRSQAPRFTG